MEDGERGTVDDLPPWRADAIEDAIILMIKTILINIDCTPRLDAVGHLVCCFANGGYYERKAIASVCSVCFFWKGRDLSSSTLAI